MADLQNAQAVTVVVAGAVGQQTLDSLCRDLESALTGQTGPITVELSQVGVLDSSLLLALAIAAKRAAESGRTLTATASPRLYQALTEWRIDTILGVSEAVPQR